MRTDMRRFDPFQALAGRVPKPSGKRPLAGSALDNHKYRRCLPQAYPQFITKPGRLAQLGEHLLYKQGRRFEPVTAHP